MANPRFAWGIDIGNRALKAVKLVRDGDLLRIDDFEFIEHETILSQAGDNRETLVQAALSNFVQRHSFKGGVVSIGVSGQSSFARFVKLPPVEERKIPEIVRFEAIQQIPFPLDDVEWSYQLFRQEDNPEVEVGIFAMRRELVNEHIKHFTDFDLNVQTVQMNPLAIYNAMHADGRFNDGLSMIIDVGTDNTDLIIADNNSIWLRSIPIGGTNFTEALVKAFKINFAKAEDLKRNAATSKYARQIFQHMRPVFADLVTEIQRSIGYYSSGHRDAKLEKIYCLGGTFKLPGLQKYLQQNLQLPVEKIDSLGGGLPNDPKLAATFGDNLLSVVSAYGLAVQAMGTSAVTSSLLPRTIQRERMWQDKTKWFGLAAALFVAGVTVVGARYFLDSLQLQNGERIRTLNQTTLQNATRLSQQWSTVQSAGEAERTLIANLQTLADGKHLWRDILTDVIGALPQPPEPLATALRERNIEAIKQVPRGERMVVQLDELSSVYDPALMPRLTADAGWRPAPMSISGGSATTFGEPTQPGASRMNQDGTAGVQPDPTGKGRGFIITMRVTCPLNPQPGSQTPRAEAFIGGAVEKAMLSLAPNPREPNRRYAVRKFWILQRTQFFQNQARLAKLRADYQAKTKPALGTGGDGMAPPGGFGGRPPGGFGGAPPGGFRGPPPGGFGGPPRGGEAGQP
ncbi:MAG TPA: type IV pilus assembly protein PilM, partial [Tepidisphaeraceae bacterium]